MRITSGNPFYREHAVISELQAIVHSCICDLDATQFDSYNGSSQIWANKTARPCDGSLRGAYDFTLGDSSNPAANDPTFNGTPGSYSGRFVLDGGDRFLLANSNTAFIKSLAKTNGGTDFWLAITLRYMSPPNTSALVSCKSTSTTPGITLATASDKLVLQQYGDSGAGNTSAGVGPLLTQGADHIIIVSRESGGAITRFWVNSRSKLELAQTYNACVSDSSARISIGAAPGGGSAMGNQTRIYSFAMGNSFIDDTTARLIINFYNARHKRTYV